MILNVRDMSVPAAGGGAGAAPARAGRAQYLRFYALGRALPAVLFGWLGWLILQHLIVSLRASSWAGGWLELAAGPVRLSLYFLFCVIPVAIYLTRPLPTAADRRLVPRMAALAGTTMLLVEGAIVPAGPLLLSPPPAFAAAGTLLLVASTTLGVWGLLYLRHSFSIVPEARRLVRGGPYAVIRHPLYAAEIGSAVALVVPGPRLWPTLVLVPFTLLQLARLRFEEKLLRATFADYSPYAARTWRLLPFLW